MRSLADILREFPEARGGLTSAQVEQSRRDHGSNALTPIPRTPAWEKFLEKFNEPIIKILLAAALLSMLVELVQPPLEPARHLTIGLLVLAVAVALTVCRISHRQAWIPTLLFGCALVLWPLGLAWGHASFDGLAVMVAVILATGVAFLSEYRSDREFESLHKHKEPLECKVRRDGQVRTVGLGDLVVGDLVLLDLGDEIPADGYVIQAASMRLDQSLLTGESEPADKIPQPPEDASEGADQPGCLYRGTQVVEGLGEMLLGAVGDATQLGQIALRLALEPGRETGPPPPAPPYKGGEKITADLVYSPPLKGGARGGGSAESRRVGRKLSIARDQTPLQQKLGNLAGIISRVGYLAAAAIFLAQLTQGIYRGDLRWPGGAEGIAADLFHDSALLLDYFMYMVIVIVVAVPEGLPMSVTVSLALAMRKMTRAHCLVRQLAACETVGSTTVICSDKTGTLTQNRMRVVRVSWDGIAINQGEPGWAAPVEADLTSPRGCVLLNAALNSTAHLEMKGNELVGVGNSTEKALLFWLLDAGLDYQQLRVAHPPLFQAPFSSQRKRMTTAIRVQGQVIALVKGAPEWVLAHSTHYMDSTGQIQPITPAFLDGVRAGLSQAAGLTMRTLAFAYRPLPGEEHAGKDDELEKDLIFTGYVAIRDPLRDDVQHALASCRHAGIQVKMITGDNAVTARAIAAEIGLLPGGAGLVLTSDEFNARTDDELKKELSALRVVARAHPLDKYRLVSLLQEQGEVVAVTGDGTNDAPALKKADIGLAMGRAGTEVAKEASKIVLLDDAFSTIVHAVHWGRALYENIQRFLQFQLTINVSALVIAFLGVLCGFKPPFTILQLLWINVIMDTFAAVALCSEPPRPGLMRLPPKKRDENIVTPGMVRTIATTALFFIVVMMALLLGMKGTPESPGWWAGTGAWSEAFPDFTVRQGTIFFTAYVLFQIWNEINCRSLVPEVSGLRKLGQNPVFLGIAICTLIIQAMVVTFGGRVFQVEPLSLWDWLAIALCTSSVVLFAEGVRFLRRRRPGNTQPLAA